MVRPDEVIQISTTCPKSRCFLAVEAMAKQGPAVVGGVAEVGLRRKTLVERVVGWVGGVVVHRPAIVITVNRRRRVDWFSPANNTYSLTKKILI